MVSSWIISLVCIFILFFDLVSGHSAEIISREEVPHEDETGSIEYVETDPEDDDAELQNLRSWNRNSERSPAKLVESYDSVSSLQGSFYSTFSDEFPTPSAALETRTENILSLPSDLNEEALPKENVSITQQQIPPPVPPRNNRPVPVNGSAALPVNLNAMQPIEQQNLFR